MLKHIHSGCQNFRETSFMITYGFLFSNSIWVIGLWCHSLPKHSVLTSLLTATLLNMVEAHFIIILQVEMSLNNIVNLLHLYVYVQHGSIWDIPHFIYIFTFTFIFIVIQVHHVTCTLGLLSHVAPCIKTEDGLKWVKSLVLMIESTMPQRLDGFANINIPACRIATSDSTVWQIRIGTNYKG